MILRDLLQYYKPYAEVILISEKLKVIDTGLNGVLFKTLYGGKELVSFKAQDTGVILIMVKEV